MGNKKYIHYGHSSFDRNLFTPIRNREMLTKPSGGLWASAVDAKRGWKDWCTENDFSTDRLSESFEFTLSENARVLHIYDVEQLADLPETEQDLSLWYCLDFEQLLNDGWDAVEVHLSEDSSNIEKYILGNTLYCMLYGWDCDSILIMNPDIVEVI